MARKRKPCEFCEREAIDTIELPTVYPNEVYCYERTDACPSTCDAGERAKAISNIPNWLYPRLIWLYLKGAGCCPAQSIAENERAWKTAHPEKVKYYQQYYEENRRAQCTTQISPSK